MKVMPGGKYIVASATRWLSPDVEREYFVIILQLCGPPDHIAPKMLLCLNTNTRVHRLQARFMLLEGEPSLVMAFVTIRYKRGHEGRIRIRR
ncbi:hypothetical protein CPB85DRAFT_1295283 [Mucidula mucida]|nr:hypothetical protein CPB85DRAFT_1295283 [Mucidula mucida]